MNSRIVEIIATIVLAGVVSFIFWKAFTMPANAAEPNVTLTPLLIDQNGKLNADAVASVSDVATNAVNVQIAAAKAEAARDTANTVTNELQTLVEQIMENNVVVYRKGFADAFQGLIVIGANDQLVICGFTHTLSGNTLSGNLEYVCTADLGSTKPEIWGDNNLGDAQDFVRIPDAQVYAPTPHNEARTLNNVTYNKWYDVDFTMTVNPSTRYFYLIKLDPDLPSGSGATLELPNGISGGISGTFAFGNTNITFVGGIAVEN